MTCKTFCNSRKRTQKGKRQNVCLLFQELFSQRNSQASFTLKVCTLIQKVKKSRKCQILSAHSSERRVSMQRRNILGKMPDLHEVPIQRGFKGIMCTLVSIKECMALLSIACYQTYCPTRYTAQYFSEPFKGFSAGLFAGVCQHC